MKIYKEIQRTDKIVDKITCDKCGKVADFGTENESKFFDIQEWLHINFIGGYGSIFEDGGEYACDLCQQCTKELLEPYLKYLGNKI